MSRFECGDYILCSHPSPITRNECLLPRVSPFHRRARTHNNDYGKSQSYTHTLFMIRTWLAIYACCGLCHASATLLPFQQKAEWEKNGASSLAKTTIPLWKRTRGDNNHSMLPHAIVSFDGIWPHETVCQCDTAACCFFFMTILVFGGLNRNGSSVVQPIYVYTPRRNGKREQYQW